MMLRSTLAGLKSRLSRLVLSSIAIVLGVAFVSGTLIMGDAVNQSLKDGFAKEARNVDVAVEVADSGDKTSSVPILDQKTLAALRAVKGVASADLRQDVLVPVVGPNGKADQGTVSTVAIDPQLRPFDLQQGRFPDRDDEIAVATITAETAKLSLGQKIRLLDTNQKPISFTISGIYTPGVSSSALSAVNQMAVKPAAITRFIDTASNKASHGYLVAKADPGVGQQELAGRVTSALKRPGLKIMDGTAFTAERLSDIGSQAGSLSSVMLVFALIALVVAAMVIYNTFTILIAQRTREMALLRCVGAERKQVFQGVLVEAAVVGAIASVIGFVVGIGLSIVLQLTIGSSGDAVAVHIPVKPMTVVAALGVGVLVTVFAAMLPARKATKVAPIEALRCQPDSHEEISRTSRKRIAAVIALGVLGVELAFSGITIGHGGDTQSAIMLTGVGTMVLLLAVVAAGPMIVGPIHRLLGVVPEKVFGMPATLAAGNARRSPKRTAATTAALLIGVAVVTTVTVAATSAKETQNREIDKQFPTDFTVTSSVHGRDLPAGVARLLSAQPEVASVGMKSVTTGMAGSDPAKGQFVLTGVSPNTLGSLIRPEVVAGDLGKLTSGMIALNEQTAKSANVKLGAQIDVKSSDPAQRKGSPTQKLTLVAILKAAHSGYVDLGTFGKLVPGQDGFGSALVKLKSGVSAGDGRAGVEKATASVPIAKITEAAEVKGELSKQVNNILALVWALIALAVVIALFGIANTLTLSVLERTRESALLRALGLTKGQLRSMLVIESILMAVMGALIGVVMGSAFAWLLIQTLSGEEAGLEFSIPIGQILVLLIAAALAAVLAAAVPARRAARASIVAGMAEA